MVNTADAGLSCDYENIVRYLGLLDDHYMLYPVLQFDMVFCFHEDSVDLNRCFWSTNL